MLAGGCQSNHLPIVFQFKEDLLQHHWALHRRTFHQMFRQVLALNEDQHVHCSDKLDPSASAILHTFCSFLAGDVGQVLCGAETSIHFSIEASWVHCVHSVFVLRSEIFKIRFLSRSPFSTAKAKPGQKLGNQWINQFQADMTFALSVCVCAD